MTTADTGAGRSTEQLMEHIRMQSRATQDALRAVLGEPADAAEAPDEAQWVIVPLRLPTVLAALMLLLTQRSQQDVHVIYANVLLRGLWALGSEEDVPDVARVAALLIRDHATDQSWAAWSARYPRAQQYVAQDEERARRDDDERAHRDKEHSGDGSR